MVKKFPTLIEPKSRGENLLAKINRLNALIIMSYIKVLGCASNNQTYRLRFNNTAQSDTERSPALGKHSAVSSDKLDNHLRSLC